MPLLAELLQGLPLVGSEDSRVLFACTVPPPTAHPPSVISSARKLTKEDLQALLSACEKLQIEVNVQCGTTQQNFHHFTNEFPSGTGYYTKGLVAG